MNTSMNRIETKRIIYDCPFCDEEHEIIIMKYLAKATIKNDEVEYTKMTYYCDRYKEEFVPANVMDENLMAAREAYREKHHYLTVKDIKNIREKYGLTQKEYARLLGVGDVTIQRYETKALQDGTYDMLMRLTNENPSYCLTLLEKNKIAFEEERYGLIRATIVKHIKLSGEDYFLESAIKAQYVDYNELSNCNGYKLLDLDKVRNLMVYFSTHIKPLYKVKLMKLLWFADVEFYKQYGRSMTGLVYKHLPLGAVPLAHNEIMGLSSIHVEEEMHDHYIAYKITPNVTVSIQSFTIEELGVLQKVVEKFKDFTTKEIVGFMHEERAYKETVDDEIVPFVKGDWVRSL